MSLLRTEDLRHVYSPGTPFCQTALDGVSFELEAGEFVGIIGHTGSGKSTLLQELNGLLKPTGGKVFYEGADIHAKGYRLSELRFRVGMVFQYPEYQLFEKTVYTDIAFGPRNMGLDERETERRVLRAAQLCGLPEEVMQRSPFELSGGQKRRAAIAGVMAMQPRVLILDEPAAGLDPSGREKILTQIKNYRDETGSAVILVSHSMDDIAKFCERIIVMREGRIMMDAPAREIFARSRELQSVGLDIPETAKTLLLLREAGFDVDCSQYTLDGAADQIFGLIKAGARHA